MAEVLILGGTDVTLAVADAVIDAGVGVRAIVHVGETFSISYSAAPVANVRRADIPAWCARRGVAAIPFVNFAELAGSPHLEGVEACLVAGWYHMAPRAFRDRFPRGCLGLHASLLPQLRGGAPLNWAILSGLSETGVSLFELGDGVDDGGVYGQARFPISARATIAELVVASSAASAALVRDHIAAICAGRARPQPQVGAPSYALQRSPTDGRIDWRDDAERIDRLVRAVGRPYPGAYAHLDGRKILLWEAHRPSGGPEVLGAPGQIARLSEVDWPCIVTGRGLLVVTAATDEAGDDMLPLLRRSANQRML